MPHALRLPTRRRKQPYRPLKPADEAIPTRLHRLLRAADLRQRDLARAIGVCTDTVCHWARGITSPQAQHRRLLRPWLAAHGIDLDEALLPEPPMSKRPARHLSLVTQSPVEEEPEMAENVPREFLTEQQLQRFGLAADPFEDAEEPEQIFLSLRLRAIDDALTRAITGRHMVALTAPCGAGKSQIIRRLAARVAGDRKVQLIQPTSIDRRAINANVIAIAILRDLIGRDTSGLSGEQRAELLRRTLSEARNNGVMPGLLIDEAHHLRPEALIAVKQVWDSNLLFRQLGVLLVGQPALAHLLRKDPAVREVAGRIRILGLQPMGADTRAYLGWRFGRIGAEVDKVFTPDAIEALAVRGEHALFINNLAVAAMAYAADMGDRLVTAAHVARAR